MYSGVNPPYYNILLIPALITLGETRTQCRHTHAHMRTHTHPRTFQMSQLFGSLGEGASSGNVRGGRNREDVGIEESLVALVMFDS